MNYIAHVRKSDNKIQTVYEHSKNVAELTEKYAEKMEMRSTAEIQGLLHDLGKLTGDFNNYINGSSKFCRGEIDHSYAGARYLYDFVLDMKDVKLNKAAFFIARTIISHHGLHDWIDEDGNDYFSRRISNNERYNEICQNASTIVSKNKLNELLQKSTIEYAQISDKIFNLSVQNNKQKPDKSSFHFYMGLLERLMQSILIDADRTDTADFMSATITEEPQNYNFLWEKMSECMTLKCNEFKTRTDAISLQRMSISERCAEYAKNKVDVCKLIVPTGGGKTLSSLRFAIENCKKHNKERIIYVAPFMSILEQNADEIRKISGDEYFLEHYSNVIQEIDDEKELADYELKVDRWNSPIIATTMVQFLNTLFSGKSTSVRRMHRLCNSVIIIDEVQSIPLKCVYLFNLAINFLTKICKTTVVLCSATQPAFQTTKNYPLILDNSFSMTGNYSEDFKLFKRTEIISKIKNPGYTYEETSEFCMDRFNENGNLLVVVNTKPAASKIYKSIKEKVNVGTFVVHLSTNMCPEHRRRTIKEIREFLNSDKPVICITTQLIEAGVDISFKCAIRSLAGLDNAIQTAGRCNRNGENSLSYVYVINISDENIGKLEEICFR